ncbi:MAG: CofH family radical SAM protein [Archaeoglobus sp.]|uniref:CofH family radical SAM protein n=1 Tax=Archaeoglobus sp. TaxID=1872626 RepID=UPI001D1A5FB3|nr:CofH family radical SAM protein [Archaeoglobus sp.]MBO8178999.1 CofH family radical SAM protein [Archaeoglobus sp.]
MKVREIEDLFYQNFHELGERADSLNDRVMFVVNRHINYTDVCVSKCPLCAFSNRERYLLTPDEILRKVKEVEGITEVHIVGGHNPNVGVEYFEEVFSRIKREMPDVVIKALTATEVYYYAKKEKMGIREFLSRLKDAGLQAMPGGGAEILVDEVRKKISPNKCSSEEWLRVMKIAHELGIRSNATMLFGHIESIRHRAIHLYKLRKLQEKTGGFVSCIPLVYHPENTPLGKVVKEKTNPVDILKTISVSRIVLDNFRSVRAYWVMLGEKLTEVALRFGANDIDGTVVEERVTHAAGAETPKGLTVERLVEIGRGAGKRVGQRDTFCNILKWYT